MDTNPSSDLGTFANFLVYIVQPMLIPCYLFLLMLPQRVHTLRNVGIQGRNQLNSNLLMPFEGFKRLLIACLMIFNMITLFASDGSPSAEQSALNDLDIGQIDSSSATIVSGAERFRAIIELLTYFSVMTLSFMQQRRQFVDAWYCQPLLWIG